MSLVHENLTALLIQKSKLSKIEEKGENFAFFIALIVKWIRSVIDLLTINSF